MAILSAAAGIIGWALLGSVTTAVLVTFWDQIRNWLNNVAANMVEKVFGYNARNNMQKAVAKVDRVMDTIRNRATVYTKKDPLDKYFVKTDIVAKAPVSKIDSGVLEEIKKQSVLVQEFGYKG